MTPQPEAYRICPGCGGKFPPLRYPNNRNAKTARPVWTCDPCYRKQRRKAGKDGNKPSSRTALKDYQKRTPGAITGPGARRPTPETVAKLRALFQRDPDAVIHRLCDLLRGVPDVKTLLQANCAGKPTAPQEI